MPPKTKRAAPLLLGLLTRRASTPEKAPAPATPAAPAVRKPAPPFFAQFDSNLI